MMPNPTIVKSPETTQSDESITWNSKGASTLLEQYCLSIGL